jgi:hypothetical protein
LSSTCSSCPTSARTVPSDRERTTLELEHLLAAEGEELPREFPRALARLPNLRHQPLVGLGQDVAHEEKLGVSDDGRQQVVEVMRDAAGEQPHALHLLRLAKLLLETPALGDVADDADDPLLARPAGVEHLLRDDRVKHALGVGDLFFVDVLSARSEDQLVFRPEDVGLALGKEVVVRFAEQLVPLAPDELAERLVHQHPAMLRVLHEDRIGDGVDDLVQVAVRVRQIGRALGDARRRAFEVGHQLVEGPRQMADLVVRTDRHPPLAAGVSLAQVFDRIHQPGQRARHVGRQREQHHRRSGDEKEEADRDPEQ